MGVQCRICESGEYDSLESLREHLEQVHELDQSECEQYAGDFSHDIDVLIHKRKRLTLEKEARKVRAKRLGLEK